MNEKVGRWPDRPACKRLLIRKTKPASSRWRVFADLLILRLVAVEQHSIAFFCAIAHRAIEQLIAFEIDLDESWTRGDGPLDQRLRQRVLNVPLQGPATRTRAVTAVRH